MLNSYNNTLRPQWFVSVWLVESIGKWWPLNHQNSDHEGWGRCGNHLCTAKINLPHQWTPVSQRFHYVMQCCLIVFYSQDFFQNKSTLLKQHCCFNQLILSKLFNLFYNICIIFNMRVLRIKRLFSSLSVKHFFHF